MSETTTRSRDPYGPWRGALPPARVRELSQLRPARVAKDIAVNWLWILAAWIFAAYFGTWWAFALAIPVVGNRYYALFLIGHDGLHRRIASDFGRNDLYCDLFILAPIFAITHINNRNHLQHHLHLANPEDPDRHKHGCFNKATWIELFGYLSAVTSVLRSVRNVFLPRQDAKVAGSGPTYRRRDLVLIACWQAALFMGLYFGFGWWGYFVLWWGPVFVFTFLADNLRSFVEHSHPESDELADEHRLVTHLPGFFERALLAPMNMNYHAAHHLWPSIPYYNLPLADSELRRSGDTGRVSWRRSYLAYLWRYFRKLPLEECRSAGHGRFQDAGSIATG